MGTLSRLTSAEMSVDAATTDLASATAVSPGPTAIRPVPLATEKALDAAGVHAPPTSAPPQDPEIDRVNESLKTIESAATTGAANPREAANNPTDNGTRNDTRRTIMLSRFWWLTLAPASRTAPPDYRAEPTPQHTDGPRVRRGPRTPKVPYRTHNPDYEPIPCAST